MINFEYKGQEIDFNEYDEIWQWQSCKNLSLAKVKEYIDRNMPKRWQPTEAYSPDYDGSVKRITVVSAGADGALWIQGSRRKEKTHRAIYVISEANDERFARIQMLQAEVKELNDQINTIYKNELQKFTVKDIKTQD